MNMNSNNQQTVNSNGVSDYPQQYVKIGKQSPNGHYPPPQILTPRIDIRLDYENLHFRLAKGLRWKPDAQALIEGIKTGLQHLGDIVRLVAYADWYNLPPDENHVSDTGDWQRDLAKMGVETRYLVNANKKNVVDFQMTHDIRDLLERPLEDPGAADLIILGTNDSDFKGLLTAARKRQRRLVLLAVKGQLSRHLLDVIDANDVYYIDEKLNLHKGRYPVNNKKQQNQN
jgi:uncharacterized LabA/DUF88 family protein